MATTIDQFLSEAGIKENKMDTAKKVLQELGIDEYDELESYALTIKQDGINLQDKIQMTLQKNGLKQVQSILLSKHIMKVFGIIPPSLSSSFNSLHNTSTINAIDDLKQEEKKEKEQNTDQSLTDELNQELRCEFCRCTILQSTLYFCGKCRNENIDSNPYYCEKEKCLKIIHCVHDSKGHKYQPKIMHPYDCKSLQMQKQIGQLKLMKFLKSSWSAGKVILYQTGEATVKNGVYAGAVLVASSINAVVEEGTKQIGKAIVESSLNASITSISAGIGTGAVILAQLGWFSYKYFKGEITWKEYGRLTVRTIMVGVISGGFSFGGIMAGAAIGAAIGSAATPVGTIIGGIIGGIVAGVISGIGANYLFEKWWPSDQKVANAKMIEQAFTAFHLNPKDMKSENLFNIQRIRDIYKQLAKVYHPDRATGSNEQFKTLGIHYGILMALLEQDKNKEIIQDDIIRCALSITN